MTIAVCTSTVLIFVLVMLHLRCASRDSILGTWDYDTVTVYRFGKHGKGSLTLPLGTYDFTYSTDENELYIDFIDETATDSHYSYYIFENRLTLQGDERSYNLERIKK